jgi:signal transduction histidine kinase
MTEQNYTGSNKIRILLVEDNQYDADLLLRELERGGLESTTDHIQTSEQLLDRLRRHSYDVVLSDYNLHGWTGMEVIETLRKERLQVPIIILSGSLGDEAAAGCIKSGAVDYILKDNLRRLPLAVRQAVEHRRLEQQFQQAQKLETVALLAGGVAHDFNNLLGVIGGYSELVLGSLGDDDPNRKKVQSIKDAADCATAITQQLLAFSRKQPVHPEVLNLNSVVADLGKILPRLLGENVHIVLSPTPELWGVKADRTQIHQVIMNLTVNARDAMPNGGRLTITTANAELNTGNYVMLSVGDTGIGMDAETQSRIYEPFFTTKEKGKGTGLGLSTVYGIADQNGGHIRLHSELGKGSTFEIYLPRVEPWQRTAQPKLAAEAGPGGSETILVVEDEQTLRVLICEFLAYKGYKMLEASKGADALELCQGRPGMIELLLTDVVMPDMPGPELADIITKLYPEIRVIYMSGYTDSAVTTKENAMFLQKPFALEELARKVREALNKPHPIAARSSTG